MTACGEILRRRIGDRGPVRVDEYMEVALTHPRHGYYRRERAIGAEGDFVTAPEVSQMFGELVAMWLADAWLRAGRPAPVQLVELGPGRGTLMADMLRAARAVPGFRAALEPVLVDIHPGLRACQEAALEGEGAVWRARLEEVPERLAFHVANEFFDALPVRQFAARGGAWRERRVGLDAGGAFAFVDGEAVDGEALDLPEAREGAVAERSAEAERLARLLGARLRACGGVALAIDYGRDSAGAAGDTLQAVRRHRHAGVLDEPGCRDLSAHVDFAALARAAEEGGAVAGETLSQGEFLERLGLGARAAALARGRPASVRNEVETARARLAGSMGGLFRVLALVAPGWPLPEAVEFPPRP